MLVEESARVQRLEIDSAPAQSRFREVDDVLRAFEGMKTGLRSFQKYVPVDLVRSLIDNQQDATLGGEPRTLTIFFSDIRGFTTISEDLDPATLATELAGYLSAVTNCINERRGTVDKYIGDAVMAFWGAPELVEDHAVQACHAALEAQHAIAERRGAGDRPDFYTRIGLHTAEVVVGNFGSDRRLNYTIIGDGVNLASRLEGVNKAFGTEILISEDTHALVGDHFETRRIGLVAVKGREKPCVTYELLGAKGGLDPDQLETVRLYESALDEFLARNWKDAIGLFIDVLELAPGDRAATTLMSQAQKFSEQPPPLEWNGSVTMETK
jgi:adenylate cyclase